MTPELLFSHFERVNDAPGAIPRLRRFILDLAVRGRLSEQDSKDEPASRLLQRIRAERAALTRGGRTRQIDSLEPTEICGPYTIPETWEWVSIGETLNSHLGGGTPAKSNSAYWGGGILWASVKDVGKAKYIDDTVDRITEAGLIDSSSNLIPPGNLIVVTRMGLGKISINRVPIAINQDLRALSLSRLVSVDYAYIFFKTHGFGGTGLTVKGIKVEELLNIPFPLPPYEEQNRIVAEVDSLMALLDQLDKVRMERESHRDRLAVTFLRRLSKPSGEARALRKSISSYIQNLPRITVCPGQIQKLRQTVFSLAVRGLLVAQEPSDEPASELIARIDNERSRLLRQGYPNASESRVQLRKQQAQILPENLESIPNGWQWATLMQCSALIVDCHNKTAPYSNSGIMLVRTTNVREGRLNLNQVKFVSEDVYERWSARYRPAPGDLLITREAPMGEVCIIPEGMKVCLGQRMMLVNLVPYTIDPKFMLLSLRDPRLMERVQDKPVGATVQHLRVGGVETLLVPVPPLAEQHRIVAKVEELMALCDRLEEQLTISQLERRRLLEAVLGEAIAAA
jgi:type I restriction enzyme S subunit